MTGMLGLLAQQAGAQGFRSVIEDAWLSQAVPDENHGSDQELSINNAPSDDSRALLKYDLSGIAPNANVVEAEAWFYIAVEDGSGRPIGVHAVTDSWTEGTVTWNNTADDYDGNVVHGAFAADEAGWARVDIAPLVQAWICGELPDYGLMLIPSSSDRESKYFSREWTQPGLRPRLRLAIAGTTPCSDAADHFVITHDAFGIHCLAETITVRVEDASDNALTSYTEAVTLDTQAGRGSWLLVSGSGAFSDPVADDGLATYQWADGESEATFLLSYFEGPAPLDIDVYQSDDPSLRDTDDEGSMVFSANGLMLTSAPLGNPPPAIVPPFSTAQTAGAPFDIYLTAYGQTADDPLCGVVESYAGDKSLSFWSTFVNPGSGVRNVTIDGSAIAAMEGAASTQVVYFVDGQAAVGAKYKDVGSIRIAVKDEATVNAELPAGIRGATAAFVSRPASFAVSAIYDAGGGIANQAAADHTGPAFIAAGAPFRATVTVLDAEGDATPSFGAESAPESVRLEPVLVAPGPPTGVNPPLSAATGFGAFGGGEATGYDFVWPEVGIIRLRPRIADGDYLGAGDVVGLDSVNVGRFVPSHFTPAFNLPLFATACTVGGFTYTGQSFGYAVAPEITATARSVGGTTTLNYTGDFFKMDTATLANRTYSASAGDLDLGGLPSTSSDPVVSEAAPGVASIVFGSGAGFSFRRDTLAAPFDAEIALAIDVLDADGVAALGNPAVFGGTGGIGFSAGRKMRHGRVRIVNALGSELVDLPVELRTEYFAGAAQGFVPNTTDSCTVGLTLALGGFTENLAMGETCVQDIGSPGSSGAGCAAPAPPGRRFTVPPLAGNFNLGLGAPGAGNHGSVRIDVSVPAWLRFDWDSAMPGDENPWGIATFGIYDGDSSQIYLRELY